MFLEILKCILCCEDEPHERYADNDDESFYTNLLVNSGSRIYDSFTRRSSTTSHNQTICQSGSSVQNREVIDSGTSTSHSASTRSTYINSTARIYEVSTDSKNASALLPAFTYNPPQSSPEPQPSSISQSPGHPVSSAKPPASSFKPSPPLCGSYQASSQTAPSNLKTPASSKPRKPKDVEVRMKKDVMPNISDKSKPTPSALPLDSTNQQKQTKLKDVEVWINKDVMPNISNKPLYKPTLSALRLDSTNQQKQTNPKDVEDLIKKDVMPNIPKKPLSKPTLSALPLDSTNKETKGNYMFFEKGTTPIYMIPKDIEEVIEKDVVPNVLKKPLSPSTYKDYFAALLYAEDFYIKKWSEFQLFDITLELHKAAVYNKSSKNKNLTVSDEKDDKTFIAFKIDSVPEERPFLLSRDFVYARHVGRVSKEFQGILYRVVKSNTVLVEFEENFYSQHQSSHKYDISFSFNRVCLKRAHQAIAAASGPLFQNYLFPHCASRKNNPESTSLPYYNYKLDSDQNSAVHQILNFQGSPPYLVEGPLSVRDNQLSKTGIVVKEAVLQIYQRLPTTRILICAPINKTCDMLMASLKKGIPESDIFRANAAFREIDGVPEEILPFCRYKGECFTCPPLEKLRQFRVIFSTFVSSFRLHDEGITDGHFSHIFLVDTSSTIEPEAMIALSNLANENTSVIVTGAYNNRSSWVRSDIARNYGLRISYFERLRKTEPYESLEPMFITHLQHLQVSDEYLIW